MNSHQQYLKLALQQAIPQRGFCAPNPAVGAVVVKNQRVLATGAHLGAGKAHAEVDALAKLGDAAIGATLYVTLEPCCHWGKTPPCTQLIVDRGIKHAIYAFKDSNPQVAGNGAAELQQAGIACQQLELATINDFYQSYAYWCKTKRPWVTAKLAMSLDGKIAGPQGKPVNITGPELQRFTHQQRKCADAILTTAKTIISDDPQLNVRLDGEIYQKPLYVLDSRLQVPSSARVFDTTAKVTLFYADEVKKTKGDRQVKIQHELYSNLLSLPQILKHIGEDGIHDLWVEAGGTCFFALLKAGLVQRSLIYIAPTLLGTQAQSGVPLEDRTKDISQDLQSCIQEHLGITPRQTLWYNYGVDRVCDMSW